MTIGHALAYLFIGGVLLMAGFAAFSFGVWVVSSFFAGVKQQNDEPTTGYVDPAHLGGRPRW